MHYTYTENQDIKYKCDNVKSNINDNILLLNKCRSQTLSVFGSGVSNVTISISRCSKCVSLWVCGFDYLIPLFKNIFVAESCEVTYQVQLADVCITVGT